MVGNLVEKLGVGLVVELVEMLEYKKVVMTEIQMVALLDLFLVEKTVWTKV
jgi:hypothetical protein